MCAIKMFYILRELGTLAGFIEIYDSVRGITGKRVIEVVEGRMDELLQQFDSNEQELEMAKQMASPTP